MTTIYLQNLSTVPVEQWLPANKSLSDVADALRAQVQRDFAPHWGISAAVKALPPPNEPANAPAGWMLYILDDADQAGALGYHDIDANGSPVLKVFVKDTLSAGEQVTVDMSHEILETLGDPFCNLSASSRTSRVYAYENCDAVEESTYAINGVRVSNFVFPQYFEDIDRQRPAQLDFLGQISAPFQLLPGGYLSYFYAGQWHQEFGSERAREKHAQRSKPRREKRAKLSQVAA